MKLRDRYPDFVTLSTAELLKRLSRETLFALLPDLAEAYTHVLPMWQVLHYYGQTHVHEGDTEKQVNCLWLSHGTVDKNRSARFFSTDRNTGTARGAVYCYKCQRSLTSFWYVYRMEHDTHERSISDTMLFIEATFGVRLPRDVILDFDSDTYYSFTDTKAEQSQMLAYFSQAGKLRALKTADPESFCQSLYVLYTERSLDKPVQ